MSGTITIGALHERVSIRAIALDIMITPAGVAEIDRLLAEESKPFIADVSGGDDFESVDDAPDGQPNADRFAGPVSFHHDRKVGQ